MMHFDASFGPCCGCVGIGGGRRHCIGTGGGGLGCVVVAVVVV